MEAGLRLGVLPDNAVPVQRRRHHHHFADATLHRPHALVGRRPRQMRARTPNLRSQKAVAAVLRAGANLPGVKFYIGDGASGARVVGAARGTPLAEGGVCRGREVRGHDTVAAVGTLAHRDEWAGHGGGRLVRQGSQQVICTEGPGGRAERCHHHAALATPTRPPWYGRQLAGVRAMVQGAASRRREARGTVVMC